MPASSRAEVGLDRKEEYERERPLPGLKYLVSIKSLFILTPDSRAKVDVEAQTNQIALDGSCGGRTKG